MTLVRLALTRVRVQQFFLPFMKRVLKIRECNGNIPAVSIAFFVFYLQTSVTHCERDFFSCRLKHCDN